MSGRVDLGLDTELYGETHTDSFLKDEDELSLSELITRILFERKSFTNITEKGLREEIEAQNKKESDAGSTPMDQTESQDQEDEQEEVESKFTAFQKQKLDLASHIASALNETSLSLDFVSLLISAVKPNVGRATMSPHLNKNVPLGSLGADRLSTPENQETSTTDDGKNAKIGYGWKYQALNNVTTLFRNASTLFNEQILKERQYWSTLSTVLDNDEVLFKARDPATGSRTIGVRYGYGDSGSSYYDQGLAIIRKEEPSGQINFTPVISTNKNLKIVDKTYKYIKIKILSKVDDDYMVTGQSSFDSSVVSSNGKPKVVNDIEKARFFLFEEDLFYHLTREAKALINYNVSFISNRIIIEISNEIIEIELVPYDENNEDDLSNVYQNINEASSINNPKAEAILTFLKLMLCCYYNYNLNLKQKIPTSLTKWKQANTHPLILRPLLGHIRHEINITNISTALKNMLEKFDLAKLKHSIDLVKYSNIGTKVAITNAFQKSIEKPLSTFNLQLENLSNKKILKVDIQVTASEVYANLVIKLTIIKYNCEQDFNDNQKGINVLLLTFTDINDLQECLTWTIQGFVN